MACKSIDAGPVHSCKRPDIPLEKWTCVALRSYLKARGLSYSGMNKAQLLEKYVKSLLTANCMYILYHNKYVNSSPTY